MHNPRLIFRLSAPVCALFLFAAAAAAEEPSPASPLPPVRKDQQSSPGDAGEKIRISADGITYSEEEKTWDAKGDILIKYGDFAVTGQECKIETENQKGFIQGDVRLQVENADITARSMEFSLGSGYGTLRGAKGVIGKNLTFSADKIERPSADRFLMEEGVLTTCPSDNQEWVFKAKRLDVRMEQIAIFKDVSLQFYGVPVFYSPYWFAPAVTKRSTGFLLPGIGYSSTGGATVKNSLFWAISGQDDATLYLDWMDKRGTREGVEYRYAPAERTYGQLNLDYLYDRGLETPLYSAKFDHRMKFDDYLDSMARVDIESRTSYGKEFDDSTLLRTRRYTDSFFNVHSTGGPYALSLTGRDQRELEAVNGEIFTKQPELLFSAMPQYVDGLPAVVDGSASAASFFTNRLGGDVNRFDARPRLSLPFAASRYFNVTPWVEGRSTWYSRSTADTNAFAANYYAAGAGVEGPRLNRIFGAGDEAWKHVITPRIDFSYVPGYEIGGDARQQAIQLDALDQHDPKTLVTFSLLNRIYSRTQADEIVRLNISQPYDYREAQRVDIAQTRPWRDLAVEFKSHPAGWLLFNTDFAYSHYDHDFSAINQELGFTWDDFHISFDRRFVNTPRSTFSSGVVGYRLSKAFTTEISAIYDEDRQETTGSLATVKWESCCWGVSFNAGTRLRTELLADGSIRAETENRFFFSINLKGIGDIGEKSAPLVAPKVPWQESPGQ